MMCVSTVAVIYQDTDHSLYTVKDGIVVLKKGAVFRMVL